MTHVELEALLKYSVAARLRQERVTRVDPALGTGPKTELAEFKVERGEYKLTA